MTAHEFCHSWGSEHDPDVPECLPSALGHAEGEHSGTFGSCSDPQLWPNSWAVTKSAYLVITLELQNILYYLVKDKKTSQGQKDQMKAKRVNECKR